MKISKHKETARILEAKLEGFYPLLINFQSGDLDTLGEIGLTITMAMEYWGKYKQKSLIKPNYFPELLRYMNLLYQSQICLVLKYQDTYHFYTRNNIIKAVRGYLHHGGHVDHSPKLAVLRNFVFEDEGEVVTFEMALTMEWVITPGFYRSTGNRDSIGPYRCKLRVEGRPEMEITLIESVILNIAFEFHGICGYGKYFSPGRIAQLVTEENLITRFGPQKGKEAFKLIEWHLDQQKELERMDQNSKTGGQETT